MRKFFGLIINEYVKILCKISTKIMLAAILVVALGFNFLMYFGFEIMGNYNYGYWSESYDDEIRRIESEIQRIEKNGESWEGELESYKQSLEIAKYSKENGIDESWNTPGAWRRDAVGILFWGEEYDEALDAAIKNNDWKAYYRIQIANNKETGLSDPETENYIWALQYKIDNDVDPAHWKNEVINNIAMYKTQLSANYANVKETDESYGEKVKIQNNLAVADYRLEHNLERYTYDGIGSIENMSEKPGFWEIFGLSTSTISIISVLIIVIAGSLLSSEFSAGTVKFLLINPVKRWKIFVAKYASVISITLVSVFILYLFNTLFAGIFFGFGNFGAPYLSAENGVVQVGSSFGYIAWKYLLGSVGMMCMATFAFAISSLVRNSALSIGLGVFLSFTGSTVVSILGLLGIYQAKYILFANTDINAVLSGATLFVNHTLGFALINIAVYMTVFLWTAWDAFVRSDVK